MFNRLFSLCLLFALLAGISLAADWPQWLGPERNNISKETGLLKSWPPAGPALAWEAPLGVGYSSVAVAGGHVYTMFQDDAGEYLIALDEKTGKPAWKIKTGPIFKSSTQHNGPRSTPTVEGDVVYGLDGAGNLVCLKTADGGEVWKKNILELAGAKNAEWGVSGSPYISGEMLLVNPGGKNGASVMALNKKNGEIIWKSGDDQAAYSTPAAMSAGGAEQFVFLTQNEIAGFAAKDGKKVWSFPWKTKPQVSAITPVVQGDTVFVGSYDMGCALLKITGDKAEKVWAGKDLRPQITTPILVDGMLYGSDQVVPLVCVDFKTGQMKWKQSVGLAKLQMTYADGLFYLYGENGTLSLAKLTPEKYEAVSTFKPLPGTQRWAPPVVANGRLYVRSDKKLMAFDVKAK